MIFNPSSFWKSLFILQLYKTCISFHLTNHFKTNIFRTIENINMLFLIDDECRLFPNHYDSVLFFLFLIEQNYVLIVHVQVHVKVRKINICIIWELHDTAGNYCYIMEYIYNIKLKTYWNWLCLWNQAPPIGEIITSLKLAT